MSNNCKQLTKVVESKITRSMWIENSRGKRISSKFVLYNDVECDNFVVLTTSNGDYIYHKNVDELILHVSNYTELIKLSDRLYAINYSISDNSGRKCFARIYDGDGNLLLGGLEVIKSMKGGLFAVKKEDKWGFMDENLNVVIPHLWENVTSFNEDGYAIVFFKEYKRMAVIDKKGSYVLSPSTYSNASFITKDLLLVKKEGKEGAINLKGEIIVPVIYSDVCLKDNFFIVRMGQKYGLIDINGKEIFECIYPEIIETDKKFVVQDFARLEVPKTKEVTK